MVMETENGPVPALLAYTDKIERIYRVLLSRKIKGLTWYRIAKEADTSYGWTHRTLKELEALGLIDGSKVVDPKGLFNKWSERKDRRLFRDYHVQNPEDVLGHAKLDFAYTGYYAENLIGHYLFPRYRELYIRPKDAASWHTYLSNHGYVGKGNVQVIVADEHVFYERGTIDDKPVVSIQQLIVDLYRTGAECAEAADLLVKRSYTW
jgi:hypothetical protein